MRWIRKGSITLYLSLILLLLLSLLYAGFASARQAAGRVVLSAATEQGLFSLFAEYDRDLFDRYGVLAVDGGYGTGELRAGELLYEVCDNASYVAEPGKGSVRIGSDVIGAGVDAEESALLGYVLMTDDGGAPFARQCCEQMQTELGAAALEGMWRRLQTAQSEENAQRTRASGYSSDQAEQYYLQDHPEAAAQPDAEETDADKKEVPEGAIRYDSNPLEQIRKLKRQGLMGLVLPEGSSVSEKSVQKEALVSGRALRTGIGMEATAWNQGNEKLLLLEYLMEQYPNYRSQDSDLPLAYQAEYAIGGKSSDAENLKIVVRKLLAIREAANLTYLMSSPARRAEADAAASGICALFLSPELVPVISFAVKTAWAFGESLLDLQELFLGGKVAVIKSDRSWQLPIEQLGNVMNAASVYRRSSAEGLTYEEYLRLLLLGKSTQNLTDALMDLTEQNLRSVPGKSEFRLDHCVDALEVALAGHVGDHTYVVNRSYGYDMK